VCWCFSVAGLEWYSCSRLKLATRIPPQPSTSKLQHTSKQDHTTNVVIQQKSRRLLMMDVLTSETCSACHTDTTPTIHNETLTHIETRTHNQSGDTIEKSQAPHDGCINVRNMFSLPHGYHSNPATPKLQHTSKQDHMTNVVIQ